MPLKRSSAIDEDWNEDETPRHYCYDTAQSFVGLAKVYLKYNLFMDLTEEQRLEKVLDFMREAREEFYKVYPPYQEFARHREETAEMYNTLAIGFNKKLGYKSMDYILD